MKNLKKLIAVVLTFTLVFSAMAIGFASPFTDVKPDAPYASAVDRLYSLGLTTDGMGDGTFGVNQPLTRAQMVTFVVRALGYEKIAEAAAQDTPAFTDLNGHWAVGYINVAKSLGITDGMGDGTFAPNLNVTFGQALAFVIRALGYKVNWGYATLAKAQDLGLTDGLTEGFNDVITRGDMAIVLSRALDQTMVSYDSNGNLVVDSNGNLVGPKLLSKVGTSNNYLVVATHDVDSNVPSGYVEVQPATATGYGTYNIDASKDGYISVGSVNFNNYLGEVVTVVSDKSGNALAATPLTTDIKTFTATVDNEVKNNNNTFTFYDGSLTVNDIPVVIDGIKTTLSSVYTVIDTGSKITLINNDNKSGYDYAVVTDATGKDLKGNAPLEILVQKNVTSTDKYIDNRISIYDGSGNPLPVIGAVSKATDIKAGDVVYQVNVAGNTVLYVVRQTVTGTISEGTYTDNTNTKFKTVTINGTSYTVGSTIPGSTGVGVSVGSTGTAVLAKNNTIVQWSGTSTSEPTNYAVVSAAQDFSSQWNTKVQLALPDGTSKVYDVVYANVYPNNTSGSVYAVTPKDIVSYTVNSSGLIDTLKVIAKNPDTFTTDKTNNILTSTTGVKYYVTPSTVFYKYDGNTTLTPVKWSDLPDTKGLDVYTYTATGINQLTLVVFDSTAQVTSTSTSPLDYVTSHSTVYNGSTTFTRLNVLENGVAKTYDATTTLSVSDGSVYQLTLDANGKVTSNGVSLQSAENGNTTTVVAFDYANNGVYLNNGANVEELALDNNVVVIDATQSTPTQVGLGSIVQGTLSNDAKTLSATKGNTLVDVYKNSTTGKVVLIVIRGIVAQ